MLYTCKLESDWLGCSTSEKDLCGTVDHKLKMSQQCVSLAIADWAVVIGVLLPNQGENIPNHLAKVSLSFKKDGQI